MIQIHFNKTHETSAKTVVILGDSTIDNRVWLGKEKYHLYAARTAPFLHRLIDFIAWFSPFGKPKSVVENLRAQMPGTEFIDSTNDGFTTSDVLHGEYRDKVFGQGTHRFFPPVKFWPLNTGKIKTADQIIISVGGNDFREFIQNAMIKNNTAERKQYIEDNYPKVFQRMQDNYQEILKKIVAENPRANIILMTQYYPALKQKTLLNTNIYDFMSELGKVRHTGNALNTIVKVMQDSYNGILDFITKDPALSKTKISVVDVTSSLNPHFSINYVGQIEPSDIGGKRIAQMLTHVIEKNDIEKNDIEKNEKNDARKIYRFAPRFFIDQQKEAHVYTAEIKAGFSFSPVHPAVMSKPLSNKFRNRILVAWGLIAGVVAGAAGFGMLATGGIAISAGALAGWAVGWPIKRGSRELLSLSGEPYRFKGLENANENEPSVKENKNPKPIILSNKMQKTKPNEKKNDQEEVIQKTKNKKSSLSSSYSG